MTKSKSIGILVVLAGILGVVCVNLFRSPAPATGIALRPTDSQAMAQAGPAAAPGSGSPPGPTNHKLPVVSTPKSLPADEVASAAGPGEKNAEPKRDPEVVVHVAGAVKHPGVYHLHAGARNDDAVKAAGGLAGNANEASVNLAAPAVDGAQLYIKNQTEQPSGGAGEDGSAAPPITSSVRPGKSAGASKPATKASNGVRPESSKPAKLKDPSEGKINLNTASSEELQRISGIGPAMAEKIISYRQESHGFQSIDDLLQISGVGAKKLAKWSPFLKLH